MSESLDVLAGLAAKVVAQASAGEQVEAYVSRGGNTDVRVYQGEVEHFVSAQSEGIGVRVIRDGRTGFAYAGTLDPAAVDEVLAEALEPEGGLRSHRRSSRTSASRTPVAARSGVQPPGSG